MRLILVKSGENISDRQNIIAGWYDAPLTPGGEEEACRCGSLLNSLGEGYDVIFTSYLSSDIKSAFCIKEKYCPWIPVIKAWQLNDRHFGSLEGKTKSEIAGKYGKELLDRIEADRLELPPPMPDFDMLNPVFDTRYFGIPQRQLPAAESLADLSERILPYYETAIAPCLKSMNNLLLVLHEKPLDTIMKHIGIPSPYGGCLPGMPQGEAPVTVCRMNGNAEVEEVYTHPRPLQGRSM